MSADLPYSDHEHASSDNTSDDQGLAHSATTSLDESNNLPLADVFHFDETDETEDFFSELITTSNVILDFESKQQELSPQSNPFVELINQQKLLSASDRLYRINKDDQRLLDIIERIDNAGGCTRPLQVLPTQWEVLIDLFEGLFPNFEAVAELLRDYFSLQSVGDNRIHFPPVLLVGEAGIGKTEAARWIANHLDVPFSIIDMASAQTGAALSGSEKFWTNTRTGQVFETLAYDKFANPIIMLDEIDKTLGDSRFDPFAPLYTLLEPSSAENFIDLSIGDFSVNASHINWIATANTLTTIPQPIQTRFTIIEIEKPTLQQAHSITQNIYRRLLADARWGDFFNPELKENIITLLASRPPRSVKMALTRALGSAVRQQRDHIIFEDLILPKIDQKHGIGFMAMQQS